MPWDERIKHAARGHDQLREAKHGHQAVAVACPKRRDVFEDGDFEGAHHLRTSSYKLFHLLTSPFFMFFAGETRGNALTRSFLQDLDQRRSRLQHLHVLCLLHLLELLQSLKLLHLLQT